MHPKRCDLFNSMEIYAYIYFLNEESHYDDDCDDTFRPINTVSRGSVVSIHEMKT